MFVGMDVHKDSIDVSMAEEGRSGCRHYGVISGDLEAVRKLLRALRAPGRRGSDQHGSARQRQPRADPPARELTAIYTPTAEAAALRNLVRAQKEAVGLAEARRSIA
jgi:hypothetical protein